MKRYLPLILLLPFFSFAQLKVTHEEKSKEITPLDAKLSIVTYNDGRHYFSFKNSLTGDQDFSTILFKTKNDAKAFVKEIGKAFSLKEGEKNVIKYPPYIIKLHYDPAGVYMTVEEKDKKPAVLTITKEIYNQVNIL